MDQAFSYNIFLCLSNNLLKRTHLTQSENAMDIMKELEHPCHE